MPESLELLIAEMQHSANQGCGLVYELYVERFSSMFDATFPIGHPERDAAIALTGGDYSTPEEVVAWKRDADEMGLCAHGLAPDHCPCGCGAIE